MGNWMGSWLWLDPRFQQLKASAKLVALWIVDHPTPTGVYNMDDGAHQTGVAGKFMTQSLTEIGDRGLLYGFNMTLWGKFVPKPNMKLSVPAEPAAEGAEAEDGGEAGGSKPPGTPKDTPAGPAEPPPPPPTDEPEKPDVKVPPEIAAWAETLMDYAAEVLTKWGVDPSRFVWLDYDSLAVYNAFTSDAWAELEDHEKLGRLCALLRGALVWAGGEKDAKMRKMLTRPYFTINAQYKIEQARGFKAMAVQACALSKKMLAEVGGQAGHSPAAESGFSNESPASSLSQPSPDPGG